MRHTIEHSCIILIVGILLAFVSSCATHKSMKDADTKVFNNIVSIQHDTIIERTRDSIFHEIVREGDTIYDTKYIQKIIYKYNNVYVHDTIVRDSIRTEYEKITIEKEIIPKWCYYSLAICGIFIIFAIAKVRKWLIVR